MEEAARPWTRLFVSAHVPRGMESSRFFVVCYVTSVDEGDGWYVRVTDGNTYTRSDRLHVATAVRSEFPEDVDYMVPFRLLDTADPKGLAKREAMLAAGWSYEPTPRCPTCGSVDLRAMRAKDDPDA